MESDHGQCTLYQAWPILENLGFSGIVGVVSGIALKACLLAYVYGTTP